MLASVLCGSIASDDYLARSHKVLGELVVDEPCNTFDGSDEFMDINNAYMMLQPGPQPIEHGFVRQSDGCWFIATNTDLGTECNGEMFDWWYRNCTDTERFKWWHPKDHKFGNWDPQFFAVQPEDRRTGYYVHHSHKITTLVGGKLQTLQIEFERPSKYFDTGKFEQAGSLLFHLDFTKLNFYSYLYILAFFSSKLSPPYLSILHDTKIIFSGVTACIVARVHMINSHGLSGVAHMIHMVREVDGRSGTLPTFTIYSNQVSLLIQRAVALLPDNDLSVSVYSFLFVNLFCIISSYLYLLFT